MSSSNKVRIISLKEAADVNKKNVAYFTLTDGTVAVVKKKMIKVYLKIIILKVVLEQNIKEI